jgi:group I intron endonuclease
MNKTNSGVYIIRNTINNHIYIGSTSDLARRKRHHFEYLDRGKHHSQHLQNSYNKYGNSAFIFSIILICDNSNLLVYEQMFIDALLPEYNICKTAGNCLGVKRSEETRAKMRGQQHCLGRTLSDSHKKIISECNHKRIVSAETKIKIGKASKERGVSKQCHEARIKAIKGVPLSEEHRAKIGNSQIGNPGNFKGKHHSTESIEKMRLAKLEYWKNYHNSKDIQTSP